MKRLQQRGGVTGLVIPLVFVSLLLFGTAGFALWAFASREDFKVNTEKKIAAAVEVAKQEASTEKDKEFVEKEKSPLKTYQGPEAYGSLSVQYPKTWSALVNEATAANPGNSPIDGFFYPNYLPGTTSVAQTVAFALRIQVLSSSYDTVVKSFDASTTSGKIKATPFKAAKVPSVLGVRMEGEIQPNKTGVMIVLPLRDKTIEIWTEAAQFSNDFNNSVVPSLSFVP